MLLPLRRRKVGWRPQPRVTLERSMVVAVLVIIADEVGLVILSSVSLVVRVLSSLSWSCARATAQIGSGLCND